MSNGYLVATGADVAAVGDIADGLDLDIIAAHDMTDTNAVGAALAGAANVGIVLSFAAARDGAYVSLLQVLAQHLRQAQLILVEPDALRAFAFLPALWPAMPLEDVRARALALAQARAPAVEAEVEPAPAPGESEAATAHADDKPAPPPIVAQPEQPESPGETSGTIEAEPAPAEAADDDLAPPPVYQEPPPDLKQDEAAPPEEPLAEEAPVDFGRYQPPDAPADFTEPSKPDEVVSDAPGADDGAVVLGRLEDKVEDLRGETYGEPPVAEDMPAAPPSVDETPPPPRDIVATEIELRDIEPSGGVIIGGAGGGEPAPAALDDVASAAPLDAETPTSAAEPAPAEQERDPPPMIPAPAAPAPQPARKREARAGGAGAASTPADATAFAPKKLRRSEAELVRISVHQPKDLQAVIRAARTADPRTTGAPQSMGIGEVALGASVGVALEVKGADCDGTLQRRTWEGEPLDFSFAATADAEVRQVVILARVFVDDAQIGVLAFTRGITGARPKALPDGERVRLKRHKYVFLSYSSHDRETVSAIATAYQMAGVAHFWDRASLKSGEEWSPRLRREIERADLFHLCWSKAAAQSQWVERETSHALSLHRRRKRPEISVQMLDGPPWAKHADSLDSINFDDFVRAAIVGYARGEE